MNLVVILTATHTQIQWIHTQQQQQPHATQDREYVEEKQRADKHTQTLFQDSCRTKMAGG